MDEAYFIVPTARSSSNRHPHEMSVSDTRNVILGIRWSDFVSNVDVQARTGLTALGEICCVLVFGHIAQLDSDVLAHMALHRRTLICQLVVLVVVTGDDVLVDPTLNG